MTISCSDAGKRYNRDWIFRHFNYQFHAGQSYAITGPNGSGKSTLLQALSGAMMLNEGRIEYAMTDDQQSMADDRWPMADERTTANEQRPTNNSQRPTANQHYTTDNIYKYVSLCAPYLELVEEMTLEEFLGFHQSFKPFLPGITTAAIIHAIGLEKAVHKQIRFYSSGMRQRVKLAQCIFSDTAIVLLDEPCTNLDAAGISLYHSLMDEYCKHRLVLVSSNDEVEYKFCGHLLNMGDYKQAES